MEVAFKIRQDLITNLNFIRLACALTSDDKGSGIFNPTVQESIKMTENFINYSTEKQFIEQGVLVLNALEPILKAALKNFPPKKDLKEISKEFSKLLNSESELFSYGIPFSWLENLIDTSKVINPDLPYQTRIGTGFHAGNFSMEEMHLLGDGFFFLILAEKHLKQLLNLREEYNKTKNKGYPSKDVYNKARNINMNTCSFARNSIINLYSFVECFVNSIGYDYYLRHKEKLSEKEIEILQGFNKKGSFLSLESKMEKYHQIIRQDKIQVFCLSDPKQVVEPFLTFFEECKEIRDAAMHYSPTKEAIWRKPTDWTEKAKKYSEIVISVAQIFWKSCYSTKDFPFYLRNLDYDECYKYALERDAESNNN